MFVLVLLLGVFYGTLGTSVLPSGRIVGGVERDIADHPWQGSYRTASTFHTCGCVYVGANFAITAAHCGGTTAYTMEFGSSSLGSGTVYTISSIVRHPNYGTGPGFEPNDITVITATSTIEGTFISPASLPAGPENPGGLGWITGWGLLCGSCGSPPTLHGAETNIISDAECSQAWPIAFSPTSQICVYNGEAGACNGDSGGPLTQGSVVYGLASWVESGCVPASPSVYARVGAFRDWVCASTGGAASGCN